MRSVQSYSATIYAGFRVGRTGAANYVLHTIDEARAVCSAYCDRVGLCVSLAETEFIYTNGGEPGCAVGLINYPRFPLAPAEIRAHALELAELLRVALQQMKVSVVFPDETVMLGEPETDNR